MSALLKCLYAPRAVELAFLAVNETFSLNVRSYGLGRPPDARHRNTENDIVIPVPIRLHHFTNQIGHAMGVLASIVRPSREKRTGKIRHGQAKGWPALAA